MKPRIFFLNQGQGPLLREFVVADCRRSGGCVSTTPDRFTLHVDQMRCVALPHHRSSSGIARLWGWFTFLILGGLRALFEPGKPLLFIVTNPPLSPFIGYVTKC